MSKPIIKLDVTEANDIEGVVGLDGIALKLTVAYNNEERNFSTNIALHGDENFEDIIDNIRFALSVLVMQTLSRKMN